MDQLDKVIQQTIYSINPSTKLPYAAGFVQVADGNGARVFTNNMSANSLFAQSTIRVTSSITSQGLYLTSTMSITDVIPAVTLTSVVGANTGTAQIRYNYTGNTVDLIGSINPPNLALTSNAVTVASLTVPTIAIGTPSYLTIAGSQNAYPPVGTITLYGGTLVPAGWLQCDGTTPLRTDYPALYAVLGIIYGTATGTTFKLPGPTQLPLIPGAPPLGMYIIKT